MNLPAKAKLMLASAIALSISPIQFAQANPFHDVLDNYFSRNDNGSYYRKSNNPQDNAIQANLDQRQATLRQQIATAQSSGRITNSQAAELSAEMSNIDAQEYDIARNRGFQYNETASLVSALGAVDTRLQQYLYATANTGFGGTTNSAPGGYFRPGSGSNNLIRSRIRSLRDRISREFDNRNISQSERDNLNSRLDSVSQQYRGGWRSNGNYTDVQAQAQLNGIESRLTYDLQHNDGQWGHHRYHDHDRDNQGRQYNER